MTSPVWAQGKWGDTGAWESGGTPQAQLQTLCAVRCPLDTRHRPVRQTG